MHARLSRKASAAKTVIPLRIPLDEESKRCLTEASKLRRVSISDYVRMVTVPQARREVRAAA